MDFEEQCCTALWRSVILRALLDLRYLKSRRIEEKLAAESAKAWLKPSNEHFRLVCEYADLNYEDVLKKTSYVLKGKKIREPVNT